MLPALLLLLVPITNYFIVQWAVGELENRQFRHARNILQTVKELVGTNLTLVGTREAYLSDTPPIFLAEGIWEIDIDGRLVEWAHAKEIEFNQEHVLQGEITSETSFQMRVRAQERYDHVYLFFDITDDSVVYREISNISIHRNDHIRLSAIDRSGNFQRYTLASEQPGTIYGRVVSTGGRALRREPRIEGTWRATDSGYQVEVKIHKDVVDDAIAFSVSDVDDPVSRSIVSVVGSGATDQRSGLRTFSRRSEPLDEILNSLGRMSFTDVYGNIVAGHKMPEGLEVLEQELYYRDQLLGIFRIAIYPDWWIEREGMRLMSLLSSISLILGLICCWWLSRHTRGRLQKLGQAVEAVVDDQGRVQGNLDYPIDDDDIGDMTQKFVLITERLKQYNEYLELLSRRLAHELRTPVSVVRSSLENLSVGVDEPNLKFVQRANNGVARLTNILNSMSEASRLEQSLDKDEVVVFDLSSVIQGCMEGYEQAFPNQAFELILENRDVRVTGIPELLAQMLDKLIDNAEQFSENDQPIVVRLSEEQDSAVLRISNSGPPLPETMSEKLFDPMISVRDASASEDSHLGLGLYVARLIAEFHGGSINLKNREDRQGAVVTVTVPLLRLTSKLR